MNQAGVLQIPVQIFSRFIIYYLSSFGALINDGNKFLVLLVGIVVRVFGDVGLV